MRNTVVDVGRCTEWMVLLNSSDWYIGDYTTPFMYPIHDDISEIVNMNGKVVYSKDKDRVGRTLYGESELTGILLCATRIEGPIP